MNAAFPYSTFCPPACLVNGAMRGAQSKTDAGMRAVRRTMSPQRCRRPSQQALLLMVCVAVDAGWIGFGPGEFHKRQNVDMHLSVHKAHLDALEELQHDYHMHFPIPNTHNVSVGTLQMMHKILGEVRQDRDLHFSSVHCDLSHAWLDFKHTHQYL